MNDSELLGRIDERLKGLDEKLYGSESQGGDIKEIQARLNNLSSSLQGQEKRLCRMERIWDTLWNGMKFSLTLIVGGGGLLAIILKAVGVF